MLLFTFLASTARCFYVAAKGTVRGVAPCRCARRWKHRRRGLGAALLVVVVILSMAGVMRPANAQEASKKVAVAVSEQRVVASDPADEELERFFDLMDADGDGFLDPKEIPPALQSILLGWQDEDHDGRISRAEYLGALRRVELGRSLDRQCQAQYGPHAEADGVGDCRCKAGYVRGTGGCVPDAHHLQGLLAEAPAKPGGFEAGGVVELSDTSFLQMLQDGGTWVVMFYASSLPGSESALSSFEHASHAYAQNAALAAGRHGLVSADVVQFAEVDADKYKGTARVEKVKGTPTVRMYKQGKVAKTYSGDWRIGDLVHFAASFEGSVGDQEGGDRKPWRKHPAHGRGDSAWDAEKRASCARHGGVWGGGGCVCRPGFVNVAGKCVPAEARGAGMPLGKGGGGGKRTYRQASVLAGAKGEMARAREWKRQADKAVSEMSEYEKLRRQCQKAFGVGAEYDGEMCTCSAGYINKGNRCVRLSY